VATDFSYCPAIKVDGSSLIKAQLAAAKTAHEAVLLGMKVGKYEGEVIAALKKVYDATWTATAVIDAINTESKARKLQIVIVPMGGSLAQAGADHPEHAAPKGVKDERFEKTTITGTGNGSSAKVEFDPNKKDPGKTLVHELLHALRDMRGQLNQVPTETVLSEYENEEEFFAMLIGNIYLSEVGRTDLRASHIVYKELDDAQKTSAGFLADTEYGKACRRLVNKFTIDDADVCNTIKDHVPVATKFNPIREFLTNTRKYPLN
jgi:hypothetical protein